MKPKIRNALTNIFAKLGGSSDYDPRVKYDTALEYYANQIPVIPKPEVGDNGKAVVAKDGAYKLQNVEFEPFIVEISESGSSFTADKTLAELIEANNAGKLIYFKFGPFIALAEFAYGSAFRATFVMLGDDGTGTNVMTFFYNTLGVYMDGDGPMASNITATLDPTYFTFVFSSMKHLELVKEGKPFVLSYQSRYLLCQLNELVSGTTYNGTLIDGDKIYSCRVLFANDGLGKLLNDDNDMIVSLSYLYLISVSKYIPHNNQEKFFGVDDTATPGFYIPKQFVLQRLQSQAFESVVQSLVWAAISSADKSASLYTVLGDDTALGFTIWTKEKIDNGRVPMLKFGERYFAFNSLRIDNTDNALSVNFIASDYQETGTLGVDPVEIWHYDLTFTTSDAIILKVWYDSVPALSI